MTPKFPIHRKDIKRYLPHRDPMLFIDRVIACEDGRIEVESDINPDAPFFAGHFPNRPIMPGVLLVETVAQTGALLIALTQGLSDGKFLAFSSVESAKFKSPVYPNDTIRVVVTLEKRRGPFYKFAGKVMSGEKVASTVAFSAAEMEF